MLLCSDKAAVYVRGRGLRRTLWDLLIVDQLLNKNAICELRKKKKKKKNNNNNKF